MQDSHAPHSPRLSSAAGARLPVLYVSHGSPMFALEPGETGPVLAQWGRALRQAHGPLRGVVVMSPHWMSHGVEVMTCATPTTWHDFAGFPPALYQLHYPPPSPPRPAARRGRHVAALDVARRGSHDRRHAHHLE